MMILVHDWQQGRLTDKHGQSADGSEEDALRIAGEIFRAGPNVMLLHVSSRNVGTRKNPKVRPARIEIHVDDQRFQQR
jgi:hypothetical protein